MIRPRYKALLVGTALLGVVVAQPTHASCASSHLLDTQNEYLVSNPDWGGAGGTGSCGFPYGCYASESAPPISSDFLGHFWSLGTGSPTVGAGDDNGSFHSRLWTKARSANFNETYYYPAWMTLDLPDDPSDVPGDPPDWSIAGDGCVLNQGATSGIDGTECTCVLLNDQWNGKGHFAVLSARVDGPGNFDLSTGNAIRLSSIPRPRVSGTRRQPNFDVEVDLFIDPITSGVFQKDGCDCGIGYKVYAYLGPRGGLPPIDRSEGWHEPRAAGGASQSVMPIDQPTTVLVDCDEIAQQDFYLSIRLSTDDGFATRYGSENSSLILCSAFCSSGDNDGDGFSECQGDCDDDNSHIYPGAPQLCDGVNNDCDSLHWPSLTGTNEFDDDLDSVSECEGDCDDTVLAAHPFAQEVTCDGIENDCDPLTPDAPDRDGDNFDVCDLTDIVNPDGQATDCDDTNDQIYPGAPQVCDGLNNDCGDPEWPTVPANEADSDNDNWRICANDCNDGQAAVNPGATEVCNSTDDNCNGFVDEDELGEDTDGDGVHNLCDNCREVDNPSQRDMDGDAVGDRCDNCVSDRNPPQSDFDSDFEGDHCDLDDGLILILISQPEYVEWQQETGFTAWNSYRGDLALLRSDQLYTQDPTTVDLAARYCGLGNPWVVDSNPPAGEAVFSLITGIFEGSNTESSLGTDSSGTERPNTAPCP